jgi:hypothetical protein
MKILCFTPLHPEYGIKEQSLDSIMALEHDNVLDRHFAGNDHPYDKPFEDVLHQHNKARKMLLDGDYDALLSVEADMIIPSDTVGRLIECNADIAYGLYIWRTKRFRRWSAYKTITLWGGESVSLNHDGEDAREAWGNIIDVEGLGMGCTLIHRAVMEKVEFRLHDGRPDWIASEYGEQFKTLGIDPYRERKGMVADDWLLAMDAKHHGFTQRNNCNVVCGHIDGNIVIWPDPVSDKFFRVENIGV